MKLATFLAPGGSDAQAGEVRGDEIVAFTAGTVIDRLASGDRHARRRPRPIRWPRVTLLEAGPAPARDLLHRPQLRGPHRRTRQRAARQAARLPQAAALSVPPFGPVRRPKATQPARLRDRAGARDGGRQHPIAGYGVADDVSARDLQRSEKQWARAKGFDTSCPWGPWITTADEVPDPRGLAHHDARQRRAAPGRQHVRSHLRAHASSWNFIAETCTLEPGAIILTGTPSGVGEAFDPPRYLQPGDVVQLRG